MLPNRRLSRLNKRKKDNGLKLANNRRKTDNIPLPAIDSTKRYFETLYPSLKGRKIIEELARIQLSQHLSDRERHARFIQAYSRAIYMVKSGKETTRLLEEIVGAGNLAQNFHEMYPFRTIRRRNP